MSTELQQQPAPPLNPMQSWTDIGLRMLDWMVSSSQQAGDQADRLARGGGPARAQEIASRAAGSATGSALSAANQWQHAGWEWAAQAWRQWFDLLGAFGRMAAPSPAAPAAGESPATRRRGSRAASSSKPRASARGKSS
ncbi:MAG: hypothetical protein V4864_07090 [Pseudomonadota bacterium]